MTRNLLRTMAASASVLPGAAMALGLGPIDVKSVLDQPLEARIPIVSARPGELDGLTANLASRELFRRMGLERPSLLRQLDFSVEGLDTPTPYIRVTSKTPIREPSVNILLEVSWPTGRMLRDFSVLLDPPVGIRRAPEPRAVAVTPSAGTRLTRTPQTRRPAPAAFDGASYGPVARGETLWTIAEAMRPDRSVSVPQMMLALLRANPDAFFQPNVNSLNAGAVLRMPDPDQLAALSRADAKVEVDSHHAAIGAAWARGPGTVANAEPEPEGSATVPQGAAPTTSPVGASGDAGLGQIRLVEAEEVASASAAEGAGGGLGGTSQAAGSGPLIQLESGGVALQLVGLEGLAERMPTIVGVHDAVLATNLLREEAAESAPGAAGTLAEAESESLSAGSTEPDTGFAAGAADLDAAAASGEARNDLGAGLDAMAAAEAFRSQVGIPSLPTNNADPAAAASVAARLSQLDPTATTPSSVAAALDSQAPAAGADADAATDDLLDFQAQVVAPQSAETFDSVSGFLDTDAVGQEATLDGESQPSTAMFADDAGESVAAAPATTIEAELPEFVYDEQGAELPMMDSDAGSVSLGVTPGPLLSPKSIATYGGGVLAFLLLLLALVRRALGGKETGPEPAAVAAEESDSKVFAEPALAEVADRLPGAAESAAGEVEADLRGDEEEDFDPAAKADVLIAMGEHAQAIDLLENALQKTPDNAHVALKILETHAGTESGDAFAEFAAGNRELLQGSGLWPQVVTMGTGLCPEHELFGGGEGADDEPHASADADTVMATQEMPAVSAAPQADAPGEEQETAASTEAEDSSADILEFKLPDEVPEEAAQSAVQSPQSAGGESDEADPGLDFDLGEFTLDPTAGAGDQDAQIEANVELDSSPLELDALEEFEVSEDAVEVAEELFEEDPTLKVDAVLDMVEEEVDATLKVEAITDIADLEFDSSVSETSQSLDLEDEAKAADAGSGEDASFVETKLDLATAYLEMGDNDGARSLYEEVVEEGNDVQRKMAEEALAKMG